MQPALTLVYSSNSPMYGGLAVGWSLNLPSVAIDTSAGAGTPRYVVDGKRLVATPADTTLVYRDAAGASHGVTAYRAELDSSFTRYGLYDPGAGGTKVWVAKSPDGRTRFFEKSDGLSWALTREQDFFGNSITYAYTSNVPYLELARIDYGANAAAGLTNFASVVFSYTLDTCAGSSLPIGAAVDRTIGRGWRRLTGVDTAVVYENGTTTSHPVHHYALGYDTVALSCTAQDAAPARYLISINDTGYDHAGVPTSRPAVSFNYGAKAPTFDRQTPIAHDSFPMTGSFLYGTEGTRTMRLDVDGDGLPDQLTSVQVNVSGDVKCGLDVKKGLPGGGIATTIAQRWTLPTASWHNGHSPTNGEHCSVTGQTFLKTKQLGTCLLSASSQVSYQFMDADADGLPDLITNVWTGADYNARSDMEASPSAPFVSSPSTSHPSHGTCPDGVIDDTRPESGLVTNGDTYRLRIWRNSGDAFSNWSPIFFDAKWHLTPSGGENALGTGTLGSTSIPSLVDMDGDGFLDLVRLPPDNSTIPPGVKPEDQATYLMVYRGNGRGFSSTPLNWSKPVVNVSGSGTVGWQVSDDGQNFITSTGMTLRDVNGDGLPDLLFHDTNLKVAWNTGTGFSATITDLGVAGPIESYYTEVYESVWRNSMLTGTSGSRTYTRRWIDVDGDRRIDIVDFPRNGQTGNPKVRFNLGTRFTAPREMPLLLPARSLYHGVSTFMQVPTNSGLAQSSTATTTAVPDAWQQEGDFVDWDGDGMMDVVTWAANGSGSTVRSSSYVGAPAHLLAGVTNGRGLYTSFEYDSSNDVAAQEGSSTRMRAGVWVVTAVVTDPGGDQPIQRAEYRYGGPVYRKHPDANITDFDAEAKVFGGFARVRSIGSAPNGASAGKQMLDQYNVRAEDGSEELIERATFANDVAGLVPATIATTVWDRFSLYGGLVGVSLPTVSATRTCAASQTVDTCRTSGALDQATTTYAFMGSPLGTATIVVAKAIERSSSAETRDSRRGETDYQLRYGMAPYAADDYRLLTTSKRRFRDTGTGTTPVWTLSGRDDFTINATTGLADEIRSWTDASGSVAVTTKVWDAPTGNLRSIMRPSQLADSAHLKLVYDYSGHKVAPQTTTNELGQLTVDTYDEGTGQLLARSGPNRKLFKGAYMMQLDTFTYDGLARPLTHSRSFDDPKKGYIQLLVDKTTYVDIANMITEEHLLDASPARFKTDVTYTDGAGRPIQTTSVRTAADGTPDANTFYVYDAAGLLARQLLPDPTVDTWATITFELKRDSLGRPTRLVRPDGTAVSVTYDGLAKTTTETTSDGTGGSTRAVYDPFGRLIELHELDNPTPGADALTRYYYDDRDNLTEVDDADTSTKLGYDLRGQRVSLDRDGHIWRYVYDLDGNIRHEVKPRPAGASEAEYTSTNDYDVLGRVTRHIPANRDLVDGDKLGVGATVYNYDTAPNGVGALAQVRQLRAAGVDGLDFLRVDLEYAAQGGVSRETRAFNAKPEPSAGEGFTATQSVVREYDALGLPTLETWDDGQSIFRSYDKRGLPKLVEYAASVNGARQTLADYGERSVNGKMRERSTGTFFGAQKRSWTFDNMGRVLTDSVAVGAAVRLDRTFTYYQDGNVHTIGGANYNDAGQVFATAGAVFTYDAQERLLTAFGPVNYAANLGYSATGNVTRAAVSGPAMVSPRNVTYAYGAVDFQAVDKLVNADSSPFAKYSYDAAGAVIARELAPQVPMNLTWNGDGQLLKVDGPGAAKIETYHYDHTGQRAWAVNSVDGTRFWFGASETRFPVGGGSIERSLNIADDSGPIARITRAGAAAPQVELLYSDRMQSLMMALGSAGEVKASFVYGAFGEVVAQVGETTHRRQFNGKENDAASGLRDYGARSYDPISLRWVSVDPLHLVLPEVGIGRPQSQNLYTFSNNNPNRWLDPDGRDPKQDETKRKEKPQPAPAAQDATADKENKPRSFYQENSSKENGGKQVAGAFDSGKMTTKDGGTCRVVGPSVTAFDPTKGPGVGMEASGGHIESHKEIGGVSVDESTDASYKASISTEADDGGKGLNVTATISAGVEDSVGFGGLSATGGVGVGVGVSFSMSVKQNDDRSVSACLKDGIGLVLGVTGGVCVPVAIVVQDSSGGDHVVVPRLR